MYENDTPLDRTTARLVDELAARIVPEVVRALADARPAPEWGEMSEALAEAVRSESARLAQTLKDSLTEEAGRRLTLTNSLVAAFDEFSSLRGLCEELARSVEALRPQGGQSRETREALSRIEEGLRQLLGRPRGGLERVEKLMRENVEEGRATRQALFQSLGAVVDDLPALRDQAKGLSDALRAIKAQEETLLGLRDGLEKMKGHWEAVEARQAALAEEVAALSGRLAGAPAAPGPSAPDPRTAQILETSLSNWEGLLRSHVQAQTHELDALSQELGTLQREGNASLLQSLQDTLSQELDGLDSDWERRLTADRAEAERRMGAFQKALWALAGIGLLSLLCSVAGLFR